LLTIETFRVEHVEAAGALLAARHRAVRTRDPRLTARFEAPDQAAVEVQAVMDRPHAEGVAALDGGRLAGFLIGSLWLSTSERAQGVSYSGYAADADDAFETYRALYAAAAPRWLALGCFDQYVFVPSVEDAVTAAWFSLGFGREAVRALRDTSPVAGARIPAGVRIRRAEAEEIDAVTRLARGLASHESASPMFRPAFPDARATERETELAQLRSPEHAYWIAEHDGRVVAMQTFHPAFPLFNDVTVPAGAAFLGKAFTDPTERGGGLGAALLDRGMAWARERGYTTCVLNFRSENLSGARFWLSQGFRPLWSSLYRGIDPRITWSGAGTGAAETQRVAESG
jgi:GNAT superfamily N-acetyltransferase